MTPMTIAKSRKDAVISGNHHHQQERDPEVLPGDDPYIITPKAKREDDEDHLVRAREDDGAVLALGAEMRFVLGLHVVNHRLRWIPLDAIGVAEDEEDPDGQADEQDHEPPDEAVADRDVGEPRRDAGRERIDGRAERAVPHPSSDHHPGAGQRVVAGSDQHGDDERVEGEALLRHAVGRAAEARTRS